MKKTALLFLAIALSSCFHQSGSSRSGAYPGLGSDTGNVQKSRRASVRSARFFDIDKSGGLNPYERGLYNTHLLYGWPLADSATKKQFDVNGDKMLDPQERVAYEKGYNPVFGRGRVSFQKGKVR